MADTDYYVYSVVKSDLALSNDEYKTKLDEFGADATTNTNTFFSAHTTTPFTGAAITDDVKRRTRLLVEQWFENYRHRYKSRDMYEKQRLELELIMIQGFASAQTSQNQGTAYASKYRSEPLKTRFGD